MLTCGILAAVLDPWFSVEAAAGSKEAHVHLRCVNAPNVAMVQLKEGEMVYLVQQDPAANRPTAEPQLHASLSGGEVSKEF